MNHTPLPWEIHDGGRFGQYGDLGPSICAVHDDGTCQPLFEICGPKNPEECRANAEFVVRACDSHDALLEACKALLEEHRLFPRGPLWVCPFCAAEGGECIRFRHEHDCPVEEARAAIAKAEGRLA